MHEKKKFTSIRIRTVFEISDFIIKKIKLTKIKQIILRNKSTVI